MITSSAFRPRAGIKHGFFTRQGGVSDGVYGSLNCGVGSHDDRANVFENRARAMARLELRCEQLATVLQVHSAAVVEVDEPWAVAARPRADAMVTRRPGVALGVLTADCGPVLLADSKAGVIGAAHAGWKGAVGGVLEATIDAMIGLGADVQNISAALGPCIRQQSYEVGPEFHQALDVTDADRGRFFSPSNRSGHWMFDLPGYVSARLTAHGVKQVDDLGLDTYADEARFFSYRRATHCEDLDYGRGLSAIVLEDH